VPNKSSLENVLKSVLSIGNAEQNMAYSPQTFDNHYNIVTAFILDQLSILYPAYIDALLPFIGVKKIAVTDGHVLLPDDYRNLLGAPSISIKPGGGNCEDNSPVIIDTASEFKTANLKAGCRSVPITMVSKGEWDYRTTSEYAFPTYTDPIGMFSAPILSTSGTTDVVKKSIKVCPYDIARVEVMYTKKEQIYRYGYIVQPDDTFIFDGTTSVDSPWEEAAFELLFKGVFALYSAYSRDNAIMEFSQILNKAGLF
jgi:hypothetical protein